MTAPEQGHAYMHMYTSFTSVDFSHHHHKPVFDQIGFLKANKYADAV
jgi:hypothetical protein